MIEKRHALKKAWKIFQPFRKHFAVSLSLLFLYEVIGMASPYFIGQMINAILAGTAIERVSMLIGVAFVLNAANHLIGYRRDMYEVKHLDFTVSNHLTNLTLEKVLGLSIGQHRSQNSGITQSVISKGQNALKDMTFLLLYSILPIAFTTIVACAMLLWFNLLAGAIVIGGIGIFIASSLSTNRQYYPEVRVLGDMGHRIGKYYGEILRLPTLIQIQSQEKRVQKEHAGRLDTKLEKTLTVWLPYSTRMWANIILTMVTKYASLVVGMFLVYKRGYRIGDFLILWAWTNQALSQIGNINRMQRQWLENWSEAKKYFSLLEIEPTVVVVSNPIHTERIRGEVEFLNVSFTYPEQRYIDVDEEKTESSKTSKATLPALSNVSFTIKEGETVAFVGESGAGKSSIVNLLLRGYDPDHGQVLVDGQDLRLLDLKRVREALGVVEQNVVLFDNTMRYNLLFGLNGKAQDVTERDLERVSQLSCIDRFQHRLVDGWDTWIGENGIKLSGGERQRVGIARALVKDSSILILDEATSSLDVENESIIKQAVKAASRGRTTIIIAHRLSTVRDADKIFVMSKGSIVGSGKHEELYESSDIYRNLINKQLFHL